MTLVYESQPRSSNFGPLAPVPEPAEAISNLCRHCKTKARHHDGEKLRDYCSNACMRLVLAQPRPLPPPPFPNPSTTSALTSNELPPSSVSISYRMFSSFSKTSSNTMIPSRPRRSLQSDSSHPGRSSKTESSLPNRSSKTESFLPDRSSKTESSRFDRSSKTESSCPSSSSETYSSRPTTSTRRCKYTGCHKNVYASSSGAVSNYCSVNHRDADQSSGSAIPILHGSPPMVQGPSPILHTSTMFQGSPPILHAYPMFYGSPPTPQAHPTFQELSPIPLTCSMFQGSPVLQASAPVSPVYPTIGYSAEQKTPMLPYYSLISPPWLNAYQPQQSPETVY